MAEALVPHWIAAGHDSLAEHIAAMTGARVVKALNQVEAGVWQQGARRRPSSSGCWFAARTRSRRSSSP